MRIASNKLSDLFLYYQNELHDLYDNDELYAVFEIVCEAYLNYTKQDVKNHFNENINQSDLLKIYDACKELKKDIPVQYVVKQAYFYDSFFYVNPATLIPRPETEELVQLVISSFKFQVSSFKHETRNPKSTILDIGTGSGCIPITLKKQLPHSAVSAIDISEDALAVANKNKTKHQVDIEFIKQDILNTQSIHQKLQQQFDIIVSNPPYVLISEKETMENKVLLNEPHLALFVNDNDPILFYKHIINFCSNHLKPNGLLYFELNPLHAETVNNYAIASKLFTFTEIIKDMSGKKRFFKAKRII